MDRKLKVISGANELEITSGTAQTVEELRKQVFEVLNLSPDAKVFIDGEEVEDETIAIPANAKSIDFRKASGSKATLLRLMVRKQR